MAQVNRLTVLARERFDGGVLIDAERSEDAIEQTRAAIAEGARVIFEAAFLADGLYARVDVLERIPGKKAKWRVSEVKSSLELKTDKHLPDLAFQVLVVQSAGLNVTDAAVITLNRDFQLGMPNDELFSTTNAWKFMRRAMTKVKKAIEAARSVECKEETPGIDVGRHCRAPYDCPFQGHCRSQLPPRHISELPRIKKSQEESLREAGVLTYDALPDDIEITQLQRRFVRGALLGERYISDRLATELDGLVYPLAFIDFEAVQPGYPLIMGTGPYERIPFQWSCHVLGAPGAEWKHLEFLAPAGGDPRAAFTETLLSAIQDAGTVLYYSPYEPATVEGLVQANIPLARAVQEHLVERGVDLLEIVQQHIYLPEFKGRYSIKKVLPALVPGFDYADLEIGDGELAALTYCRMLLGEHPDPEGAFEALRRYCQRDTEAMVRVFEAMRSLAAEAG